VSKEVKTLSEALEESTALLGCIASAYPPSEMLPKVKRQYDDNLAAIADIDADIDRLEGRPRFEGLAPQPLEVKIWKRAYCVALYANEVLRGKIADEQRITGPMVFFYPKAEDQ
jgi:hypothetical protein